MPTPILMQQQVNTNGHVPERTKKSEVVIPDSGEPHNMELDDEGEEEEDETNIVRTAGGVENPLPRGSKHPHLVFLRSYPDVNTNSSLVLSIFTIFESCHNPLKRSADN